jgi:hypothetical protein
MIRFFSSLIRYLIAFILVILCVLFFGPFLAQKANEWRAQLAESPGFTERFQSIDRVRELLKEKALSEVGLNDLLGLLESTGTGAAPSGEETDRIQAQLERLGLTPADLQELSEIYLDLRRNRESPSSPVEVEPSEAPEPSP